MAAAPDVDQTAGQIITFYSYKGGTGRSMAVANVGYILATRKPAPKVLLIDWDLEAPGLHRYFVDAPRPQPTLARPNATAVRTAALDERPGLVEFFTIAETAYQEAAAAGTGAATPTAGSAAPAESRSGQQAEPAPAAAQPLAPPDPFAGLRARLLARFEEFLFPAGPPNLLLLKAGNLDPTYPDRLSALNWKAFHERDPRFFADLRQHLMERYAYTLIDSRTGLTDTSGICAQQMPEKLVLVFVPNHQSLDGVLDVARRASRHRAGSLDIRPLVSFPLASRIDSSNSALRSLWRRGGRFGEDEVEDGYQGRFEKVLAEAYDLDACDLEGYFDATSVLHDSYFAYGEKIAARAGTTDPLSLGFAYANVARRLGELEAPWLPLPETSELEEAKRRGQTLEATLARSRTAVRWIGLTTALAVLAAVALTAWALLRSPHVPDPLAAQIVGAAKASPDPLEKALLLCELQGTSEPAGGLALAQEVATTPFPRALLRGPRGPIFAVTFFSDGRRVALGSADYAVRVFDLDGTGKPMVLRGGPGAVTSLAFSPDGGLLAAGAADGSVRLWRTRDGALLRLLYLWGSVRAVAFRPGGQSLAMVSTGGMYGWRLVDAAWTLKLFDEHVTDGVISEGGNRVATSAPGLELHVFDAGDFSPVPVHFAQPSGPFTLSADGRYVVFKQGKRFSVFDTQRDEATFFDPPTFKGEEQTVGAIGFSPDRWILAAASLDGSLWAWKSNLPIVFPAFTGLSWMANGPPGPIRALAVDSRNHVVTGADDGTARVWNVERQAYQGSPAWAPLLAYLRGATTACLTVSQRTSLLSESASQARQRFEQCERRFGRTP